MASKSNKYTRKIGYARVSTADQNPDMQITALKRYGVPDHLIFTEKASGGTMKRPAFARALKTAQHPGSEFVVWKLDRLGRTVPIILETLETLRDRGVRFVSLTEQIDVSSPTGHAFMQFSAMMAELERNLIIERTNAGIQRARERGKMAGRKPSMTPERIAMAERLLSKDMRGNEVWAELKKINGPTISRAAYYKWQKQWDELNKPKDGQDEV